MEIVIKNVVKSYGKKQALKGVSLEIGNGMFGLLGSNGAGKTTLMRILSTLLKKDGGDISINGVPVERYQEIRRMVGYLPQDYNMYPYYSVYETLDYTGLLCGVREGRKQRIEELLSRVNLSDNKRTKLRELSGGMRRRLGIAAALMNAPQVLIVDEPTAGLDPEERLRFRNLLAEFGKDRIVLLSTHIVSDVESVCGRLAVLKEGELRFAGSKADFIGSAEGKVWALSASAEEIEKLLHSNHAVQLISRSDGGDRRADIRVYAKECPCAQAVRVEARAEDAYVGIMA